jgi:hypothetical protein
MRAGCAAQAAGTLSRGGEDRSAGRPRRGFRTPGPRFTGLAGGVNEADLQAYRRAARRQRRQNVPGCRDTVSSRRSPTGGKIRTAAGASGDLGRAAGRPGVGETTVTPTRPRTGAGYGTRQRPAGPGLRR